MKWIKNRGDRVFSALLACTLLASAIMVSARLGGFQERFAEPQIPAVIVDPPARVSLDQVMTELTNPPAWTVDTRFKDRARGSLFVSEEYILGTKAEKAVDASIHTDSLTGEKIPNLWFMENGLNWKEGNAPLQDPDRDGFTNEDERRFNTNPNDKNSHPPYYTKLFLKQIIRVPCHLAFKTFDGDINKPKTWQFQVDTIDIKQPTAFLKIGEMIPSTKFKLERYAAKEVENVKIKVMVDASELTLVNTETGESVVLVLGNVTDAPEISALFDYQWPPAAGDIRVRKLQDFGLKPESDRASLYRLMDVNETEATIRLPDGEMRTIGHDPRKVTR